jgi:type III pantothenate kinase
MNICIDIGNTLTKAAVFEGDALIHFSGVAEFGLSELHEIIKNYPAENAIISSVGMNDPQFFKEIESLFKKVVFLGSNTRIPIENHYHTPETLGKDRLAAVVGANSLHPGRNILVIDAGSAITFDFINAAGEYKGGNIAPGLTMRFRALHEFTQRLPMLGPAGDMPVLGRNTSEAIIAGVQNSMVFETDAYISELTKVHDRLITLITGGDAKFFDNKLKNTIFVIPNLVLIGLNRILNFNA